MFILLYIHWTVASPAAFAHGMAIGDHGLVGLVVGDLFHQRRCTGGRPGAHQACWHVLPLLCRREVLSKSLEQGAYP